MHTTAIPRYFLVGAGRGPGRFLVPSNRDRPSAGTCLRSRERTVWIWDDLYRALLDAGAGGEPR